MRRALTRRQEINFTTWLAKFFSGIVTLSAAKGLAARFFAEFILSFAEGLRMTLV